MQYQCHTQKTQNNIRALSFKVSLNVLSWSKHHQVWPYDDDCLKCEAVFLEPWQKMREHGCHTGELWTLASKKLKRFNVQQWPVIHKDIIMLSLSLRSQLDCVPVFSRSVYLVSRFLGSCPTDPHVPHPLINVQVSLVRTVLPHMSAVQTATHLFENIPPKVHVASSYSTQPAHYHKPCHWTHVNLISWSWQETKVSCMEKPSTHLRRLAKQLTATMGSINNALSTAQLTDICILQINANLLSMAHMDFTLLA